MIYSIYRDLADGEFVSALGYDIAIHTRSPGMLNLPTGKLVACDPIVHPTSEAFDVTLPKGDYPVHVVIAELRDEARIAYATIHVKPDAARSWKVATVPGEDTSLLSTDEHGYTVVSSLGCFMDAQTADRFVDYLEVHYDDEKTDLEKSLDAQERRATNKGVSFASMTHEWLEPGNILSFSTGFGEGFYQTYVGKDHDGEISRIVTDFRVLDFRFPSFGWG